MHTFLPVAVITHPRVLGSGADNVADRVTGADANELWPKVGDALIMRQWFGA